MVPPPSPQRQPTYTRATTVHDIFSSDCSYRQQASQAGRRCFGPKKKKTCTVRLVPSGRSVRRHQSVNWPNGSVSGLPNNNNNKNKNRDRLERGAICTQRFHLLSFNKDARRHPSQPLSSPYKQPLARGERAGDRCGGIIALILSKSTGDGRRIQGGVNLGQDSGYWYCNTIHAQSDTDATQHQTPPVVFQPIKKCGGIVGRRVVTETVVRKIAVKTTIAVTIVGC